MKSFKKILAFAVSCIMILSCITAINMSVVSAAPSVSGGWNETLYAEWADTNPDAATVEYKLHSEAAYTKLEGDDAAYLIRPASSNGFGRVDIPGLKAGRYDIKITASDGTVHSRENIEVFAYDRSGYAHWNRSAAEHAYTGIGAYKDDGTLKDNAIVLYLTNENKDTLTIPGYENAVWDYTPTNDPAYKRTSEGIGNILNNNYKFIDEVTKTHPLVIRIVGKVTTPKNLTPYNVKDPILGGAKGDNGNLAVMKWGRNVTLEGIGEDAEMEGWGFSVSKTNTHPADSGQSVEVRNITFRNYTEDGLGFQGEGDAFAERIWVHNNVFYPGHCDNPAEGDKGDGDGSCDFKRGRYYTMSYNKFIDCHKTNLLGSGSGDDQWFMTLHHNWYQNVASRQPLAANGNVHIYNTYFQNGDTTVDTRCNNATFLEENYYENCKSVFKSRNDTCYAKSYNDIKSGGQSKEEVKGTYTVVADRTESVIKDNGFKFPDGSTMADFDMNPDKFYYDTVNKKTNVSVLNKAEEVPAYVTQYAGTQHAFPAAESGTITITVTDEQGAPLNDAILTSSGLNFTASGNVYTARAELGAEYQITVAKEGYASKIVNPAILLADGEEYKETVALAKDYDGLAAVKLTGGSDNAPVKGATVTLNTGDVLKDMGDGTYVSDKQYPVDGTYSVTVTNVGDYIAQASYPVTIKTTDEPTEIHLDKAKGKVSVTVTAAEGSAKTLDPSAAVVNVGATRLTYDSASNAFTGEVDINTAFDITASLGGWKVLSIEPAKITATKDGIATAVVTMQEGGEQYTWNYTDGTNTDDFFTLSSGIDDFSAADENPIEFEGQTLTKAIKLNSGKYITFNAPADGELIIVAHNRNKDATISINGGEPVNINIGQNGPFPVSAGEVMIERKSGEACIYLMRYTMTGEIVNPAPGEGTTTGPETPTEGTTEAKPEITTYSDPVELGPAKSNDGAIDGGSASVTYDEATDTWSLSDTSSTAAANLIIPLVTPITSNKVIITGTVTPSANNSKWGFLRVVGTVGGVEDQDVAAFATDTDSNVSLRTGSVDDAASPDNYVYTTASPAVAVTGGKTYNYVITIDMDAKTATLSVDGITGEMTHAIKADAITGVGSTTARKDTTRTVKLSTPYVGIPTDAPAPEGLSDEIMWSVEQTAPAGTDRGLTFGEDFGTNEDDIPRTFADGDKSYDMSFFLQGKNNPLGKDGATNPMSPTNDGIPVSGAYMKYEATADGVFTAAVKTSGGKVTYVTDDTGTVIRQLGSADPAADTTYDIIRFNVKAGHSYNIFAVASKICVYYLGFTSGISVPDPELPSEETTGDTQTEGPTESTTDSGEQSTEGPTESTTDSGSNPPEPGTEGSTAGPNTEDTTTPEPGTEGSTAGPNTEDTTTPEPGTEGSTEGTTAGPNTESTTEPESSSETTTEPTTAGPEDYGDADGDRKVEITDVEAALQYVLKGVPFSNEFRYLDVDNSGKIDSEDVAMILQHVLDSSFNIDPTKK